MQPIKSSWPALLCLAATTASVQAESLLVSHYNGNVYSLSLSDGDLSIQQTLKAGGNMPSWLTLDAKAGALYVTDEASWGNPVVTQLSVDADGKLAPAATAPAHGGELHSCLYGGSDGTSFLAAAEYDPSSMSTWKLPLSSDTKALERLTFTMSGPGPVPARQDKPHPHSTFTDPTGQFLLSADLGADLLRIFRIDASSGKLDHCADAKTGAGDGPRHGAWWSPGSANGTSKVQQQGKEASMLYIVNELANTVTAWQVSYPDGDGCLSLDKTQSLPTREAGKAAPPLSKAAEVQVAGDFLYAAVRNDQAFGATSDSVATFSINRASGAITYVESTDTHTYFPRTFSINKAGDKVAFGGQTSGTVAIIARDTETGRLGDVIASLPVGGPGTFNNEDGLSHVIWNE